MPSPSRSLTGEALVASWPASFGQASIPSGMPSLSLSGSGQPSSSWKPSLSSGWSGHLSLSSGMRSPSRSLTGQPWLGRNGPGSLGHLSLASSTPSLSLSGSGQPSSSWKPSLSSGLSGHLSSLSGMPSLSVSTISIFTTPTGGLGGLSPSFSRTRI